MVRNVVVAIAEDTTHQHSGDLATIVGLGSKVDDGDDCSNQDVQACSFDTGRCTNVDGVPDEVFDGSSTVEDHQDCEDDGSDDSGDHAMPPE